MSEEIEPILQENDLRFVLFPIKYQGVWDLYKEAQSSFWTAEELSLAEDATQWKFNKKITDDDKYFIKNILAFFASSDGIVNENLAARFMTEVQIPELRALYGYQIATESVHSEVYSLLIDTLIENVDEKQRLFEAVNTIPIIKKMADWTTKWISSDRPFAERLIAFACVEGILFSGPFCAIYWLKKRALLPGLCMSNELISRDEGLHTMTACHVYKDLLKNKAKYERVLEIMQEVVDLEIEFIKESIPVRLIGMNADSMEEYIKCVSNKLLEMLGYPHHWNVKNPFPWMQLISIDGKTNFFEDRPSEYSRAGFKKKNNKINNKEDKNNKNNNNKVELLNDF
jgi:ribonucleotide reductase beta subunit family protein with ferritin-like domain